MPTATPDRFRLSLLEEDAITFSSWGKLADPKSHSNPAHPKPKTLVTERWLEPAKFARHIPTPANRDGSLDYANHELLSKLRRTEVTPVLSCDASETGLEVLTPPPVNGPERNSESLCNSEFGDTGPRCRDFKAAWLTA